MAGASARALAADKRWGCAAAAAAAPGRPPASGVLEAVPKPANLPSDRGAVPWDNRTMLPAPNAWGSSSLLSLKKGEGSGSVVNINDHPSSPGSSSTSTDESDLLDSPVARGLTSVDSVTAISRPQSTELRSRSWKFPDSQNSFSDVLKAPLRTIAKRRPTSHRKGFTICADDFPVFDSKNSQSNGQQGHSFQGRPSFSSVVIAARDEQRKIPLTGGDPVSTANLSKEPEHAQLHATQPDICMPPPCIDYWHPPPDHPPDRNGICLGGLVSYGPCKPADNTGSFPVESFTHDGQSLLNQGGEERHGRHRVSHPESNDSCYAHVPVDTYVKSLPLLILEKVKDNHSDALEKQPDIKKDVVLLEKMKCLPHLIHGNVKGNHSDALQKQPVIKKDVALLEKIKFLNIKARNLRAHTMPEKSPCIDSMVERSESLVLKADHVANDVPFSTATSYITSAFDMANSVSERSNHVLIGASNMSTIHVTSDLSEGHATEFSEAKKMGKSSDNHVYEVVDSSTNLCGSSDTASNIWGHGWKEHSTVYSLPVTTTSNHEDQQFAGNFSQQVHGRTANDMLNSPNYEIQHSRRDLSAQNARHLQQEEREKSQQKLKPIAKMEDWNRYFCTKNTETSGSRKPPVSGVVINSSITTMQAALARGFTVGSIMLGDASVASVNQEKTVAKEVDCDATNSCASQTKQSGKNQHDEQHAKDPHGGDSIMCTEVKEQSKQERPEARGVNFMAIPAPNQPSVNQSTVLPDAVPANTSEMERHSYQPEYKKPYLQNPRHQAEKHIASSDNSSGSILQTKSHHKETLHTSTTTKSEVKIERENQEDEKKKISKHLVRSSAASGQGSTTASATLPSDLTEQEANSLVLKIIQELSDQLEQVEKQLDATHVVAVSRSEPTQMVSLPGYTWGEHHVSHSQRQYHVDGQGNVWFSYAADMCSIRQGVSAHVLPGPVSVPENNTLNGSSAPVWTWDATDGVLTSDMDNVSVVGTAITSRSCSELTESIYGVGQMDLHCTQVVEGMPYYEAVTVNPEIQYHASLAHQQVNPAWFPHSQQDMNCHSSSGTGVFWPQRDVGTAMQTHGVTGPIVGDGHPGYQLMPVASPGAAYTGNAMDSAGHPAAAWTWGAAYNSEHVYYA